MDYAALANPLVSRSPVESEVILPDDVDALLAQLKSHFKNARRVIVQLKRLAPDHWRTQILEPSVTIPQERLENCQVVNCRAHMLSLMPRNGLVVEVGTLRGEFAKVILETCAPKRLITIDQSYQLFDFPALQKYIDEGVLQTIQGCSWEVLSQFPDGHFDLIYIDAAHDYDSVAKDLDAARTKVKKGGYLACNDYTYWAPEEAQPYGVPRAVHEFVVRRRFRVSHLCLQNGGFFDIVLQRY